MVTFVVGVGVVDHSLPSSSLLGLVRQLLQVVDLDVQLALLMLPLFDFHCDRILLGLLLLSDLPELPDEVCRLLRGVEHTLGDRYLVDDLLAVYSCLSCSVDLVCKPREAGPLVGVPHLSELAFNWRVAVAFVALGLVVGAREDVVEDILLLLRVLDVALLVVVGGARGLGAVVVVVGCSPSRVGTVVVVVVVVVVVLLVLVLGLLVLGVTSVVLRLLVLVMASVVLVVLVLGVTSVVLVMPGTRRRLLVLLGCWSVPRSRLGSDWSR